MLLDSADQVMASYAPTDHTSTALFQSYIDRLVKMEDGAGADLMAYINVAAAVTSGGSGTTVQFQVIGNATDNTFASGNVVLADSGAIVKATLVAGYQIPLRINHAKMASLEQTGSFLRYLTILVTIGSTADLTAGTFNGWITPRQGGIQDNLSYAAGYTV